MNDNSKQIYKVIFLNQGEIFEIYAKNIYQSDLFGFVEVEEFLFGERTKMVVDPSEEKLKSEFEDVGGNYLQQAWTDTIFGRESNTKSQYTRTTMKVLVQSLTTQQNILYSYLKLAAQLSYRRSLPST